MNADWQPIETAPKDGRRVLTVRGNGYVAIVQWRRWRSSERSREWVEEWSDDSGAEPIAQPTHWMPLPEAPK